MKRLALNTNHKIIRQLLLLVSGGMILFAQVGNAAPLSLSDGPLYLKTFAKPILMLNISKDHQLYFKAFDDYSDLDSPPDNIPETTYKHSFDYYGYFDSQKCYTYNTTNTRFEPSSISSTKYCVGQWSGNFLNWASMTRIDTIRKILYGGKRTTDLATAQTTATNTTAPVTTAAVATGSATPDTPYVLVSGPTRTSGPTEISSVNGPSTRCDTLPITSAESAPTVEPALSTITAVVGTATNGATTNGTPANTAPVTTTSDSALGTTTTTAFDSSYDSTFTTTTPSTKTTTYTTTFTIRTRRGSGGGCGSSSVSTTVKTYRNTYSKIYRSTTTTPYQTTTTTTTATTTQPVAGATVLERSYLPNDAHSFAKFYNGADLDDLTPFSGTDVASGITLCNTTETTTVLSQAVTSPPLIRVAKGNFSLWAANERWQCRWSENQGASNSNDSTASGIGAGSSNPSKSSDGLGSKDYVARIKVCDDTLVGGENCKIYSNTSTGLSTFKPIGLLQTYGDTDKLNFGLMTGSYDKNKSGGVLRKNVSSMADEINVATDGTFKSVPSTGGIINSLDLLRIHGYRHDDGTYFGVTNSDDCPWGLTAFSDGDCNNWGNPQSEIFLESLRYLSNNAALSAFLPSSPDSGYISGLGMATPVNPIVDAQWCAKLNVIQFNASTSSYDGDQLASVTDLGASGMDSLTDVVGAGEGIHGNEFFVGENGTDNNQLCTAKTVGNLSKVKGTCPDAPRLSGSYHIAGLAQYAHNNDIRSTLQGKQTVTMYGVALAPAIPKIEVPVPGGNKKVTILPACRNTDIPGNCALVDFKIVHQNCSLLSPVPSGSNNCGKIYVNWEDSEQGGDFDQDEWGILTYTVSSSQVSITTDVIAQSSGYKMGFGYIISGTTKDGFHTHSGMNSFNYTDPQGTTGCSSCITGNAASTVTYTIGSSNAKSLQQPLSYAAKWGSFDDFDNTQTPNKKEEWDTNNDGIPDRYFFAIDPKNLETSLGQALDDVVKRASSASAAAANSTSVTTGTVLYQAQFNSLYWSGHLYSFNVTADGTVRDINGDSVLDGVDANWDAATLIPAPSDRNIKTINGSGVGVDFLWSNLSAGQQTALKTSSTGSVSTDAIGQDRLDWLRGNTSKEVRNTSGIFRDRETRDSITNVLGDIIDSDPTFSHLENYGYKQLPTTATGQSTYEAFVTGKRVRPPMVYAGANDGMLHGFRGDTGNANSGKEAFAYVPASVYGKLSSLTEPNYTHKFFVDGNPSISDAYLSGWKTVLAGGLGGGGKAIYALDISNPEGFTNANVLWEYSGSTFDTGSTGTTDADGLGLTFSLPQIARLNDGTNDGTWVVIFGNGYNSTSEKAFLYIVNLSTGNLLKKIPTNSATSNGLSTPVLYDSDGDKTIDFVYAGDLQGNLWKFDLTATTAAGWGVSNGGNPLFTARNSSNQVQPITAPPRVGGHTLGGAMVYFGTGSYLTTTDSANKTVQSFYAIWDKPSSSGTVARSSLVQQTITEQITAGTTQTRASCTDSSTIPGNECEVTINLDVRSTSDNAVDYTTKLGWYLDLVPPVGAATGERINSPVLVKLDRVIFLTKIPSEDPCKPDGDSWLMELDATTGSRTGTSAFDFNNDDKFDEKDTLASASTASGVKSTVGIVKDLIWLDKEGSGTAVKELSGTTSNFMTVKNRGAAAVAGTVKRLDWLQIQ
jgi:type IV pilus assembly protein PilY1